MNNKILETVKSFDELSVNPEVFISPSRNFRCRIEFGYKNDSYTMIDGESQIFFSKSNVPIKMISNNMEIILHDINCSNFLLNYQLPLIQQNENRNGTNGHLKHFEFLETMVFCFYQKVL